MNKPKVVIDNPVASPKSRRALRVDRGDLDWAASEGVISPKQAEDLWGALQTRHASRPQFDLAHLFWYAGAIVVLVAMGWFFTEVGNLFGAGGVLVTSLVYAGAFLGFGAKLWHQDGLKVPGGLLVTLSVLMTPVTTVALTEFFGHNAVFDSVNYQLLLEGVTIVAALGALRFFKFPFLTMPIYLSLWLASMTVTQLLFSGQGSPWDAQLWVTLGFGLFMIVTAFVLDRRTEGDYSFWGYLFGTTAFWFSLTFLDVGGEFGKLIYLGINVGMMLLSVLLARRIFLVYGSLGALGYLFHLAYTLFAGSLLFPFVLTGIGIGIIVAGIKYHRNRASIDRFVLTLVPGGLKKHLPDRS